MLMVNKMQFIDNSTPSRRLPVGVSESQVLSWAQAILEDKFKRSHYFNNPNATREYLQASLAMSEREQFALLLLDSQHGLLHCEIIFQGTINSAPVYPREIVKTALAHNAAAVILAHNHPSGHPEPSDADKQLTDVIVKALNVVDIRVLDHFIIGGTTITSFAERGLL